MKLHNLYDEEKIHDACGLFGMMNASGVKFSAYEPVKAILSMKDRGNGLGAGFAIYGIYPDYKEDYALHIMYLDLKSKKRVERFLLEHFDINFDEEIPTDGEANVLNHPILWRYFVQPKKSLKSFQSDECVKNAVMKINTIVEGAFVLSSGKNMGIFKGVGSPADIAEYFLLKDYKGYMWLCHTRFPTNTPGWWGGAHPFGILDWSIIHNGELSSYGTNRRYLEMHGYKCVMRTDTEVMAYAFDLLVRMQSLPIEIAAKIFAPPLWMEIEAMPKEERAVYTALRQCYGSLLMNGPFTIIAARHGEMIGLADRMKLRPLSVAMKGDFVYMASEEAAIKAVCRDPDKIWNPRGGEAVIGRLKKMEEVLNGRALASKVLS